MDSKEKRVLMFLFAISAAFRLKSGEMLKRFALNRNKVLAARKHYDGGTAKAVIV